MEIDSNDWFNFSYYPELLWVEAKAVDDKHAVHFWHADKLVNLFECIEDLI